MYGQTKRCLEIIAQAIASAGLGLDSVIRTRVMLTDMSRWEEAARAHGEMFSDVKPASTFVEVKGLVRREWLVEIEADCIAESDVARK
jgi:enamine deaminase RidA (YjgF/YER057c/UK114 family)